MISYMHQYPMSSFAAMPQPPVSGWPHIYGLAIPSQSETPTIKNTSITIIDEQLSQLTERQGSLITFIRRHQPLVSPIYRLPVETIAEIFRLCLLWRAPTADAKRERSDVPHLLAQVCHHWRSIAVSTPTLWSEIDLSHDPSWNDLSTGNDFQRTKLWLQRSGEAQLSILITREGGPFGADGLIAWDQVPDVLVPSIHRWNSLTIVAQDMWTISNCVRFGSPLGKLQHLSIKAHTNVSTYLSIGIFESASLLRSLELSGRDIVPQQIPIPWSRLTHFSGEEMSGSAILYILHNCPDLVFCSIDCFRFDTDRLPPLHHENLRELTIKSLQAQRGIQALLDCWTVPRLLKMHLGCREFLWTELESLITAFNGMLSRSSCSLERLTWDFPVHSREEVGPLFGCLSKLPHLAELNFCYPVNPTVFHRLTFQKQPVDAILCPQLYAIAFLDCDGGDEGSFVRFVTSRESPTEVPDSAPLRMVRIGRKPPPYYQTSNPRSLPEIIANLRNKVANIHVELFTYD